MVDFVGDFGVGVPFEPLMYISHLVSKIGKTNFPS